MSFYEIAKDLHFFRETTQDGLENFFGCVKTYNQNNKPTPSQYRTGYTTMLLNNISTTNSLQSNCQPDQSTAMLPNIHEFITEFKNQPLQSFEPKTQNITPSVVFDPEVEMMPNYALNTMILFEPQIDESGADAGHEEEINLGLGAAGAEVRVIDTQTISNFCSRICQKLIKTTKCMECKDIFQLMDENDAILSVEQIYRRVNETIPTICHEAPLKKKLLEHIQPQSVHIVGCAEHTEEIEIKTKSLIIDDVIRSFCNDINKILANKTQSLPDDYNDVQEIALAHRNKNKGIGKYSDIF